MKKIKIYIIMSIILVLSGMFLTFYIINHNNKRNEISLTGPVKAGQISDIKEVIQKLKLREVTINQIKQNQELIVMEVDLEQSIKWDDSWGDLDVFKKYQDINFYGIGLYTTDLSKLDSKDIVFDYLQNKVYVNVMKPEIKTIEIDEDKTTYKITETGIFRFGDVKITPAQSQMMSQEVKTQMKEKMNNNELYNKALLNTEISIKNLVSKIITDNNIGSYEIVVNWK